MTLDEYVEEEVARVRRLVHSAFAGVPRPHITKRVAVALDDEWIVDMDRALECDEIKSLK
ncbi:MAG: hypothetical protein V4710_04625 [Verrucomicrobiota bacterium]